VLGRGRNQQEELPPAKAEAEAEEMLRYKVVDIAGLQVVRDYTSDLRTLPAKFSITERRGFLKSLVERCAVFRRTKVGDKACVMGRGGLICPYFMKHQELQETGWGIFGRHFGNMS